MKNIIHKFTQKSFLLITTTFLTLFSCGTPSVTEEVIESRYINPVFEHNFADPTIIRDDDGRFWAFATEGRYASSIDLVNWEYEGNVFITTGSPLWGSSGAHIWAPDIVKIGDTYMYYYSLSRWGDPNPGIGYNYTDDLSSHEWHKGEKLFTSDEIGVPNSIDPAVYVEDGRVYMFWGSFHGIYVIELTSDGKEVLGGIETGRQNKIRLTNHWYEGVYIEKINDYYYMFVSSGSCCESLGSTYHVKVYRSENLLGPYVDPLGVDALDGGGLLLLQSSDFFKGPGHNAVISDDFGQYWIIYHSYSKDSPIHRQLLIDQLYFDEDGWPFVINNMPSHSLEYGPKVIVEV